MNACVISGLAVTQERASVHQIETASRSNVRDWFDELLAAEEVAEGFVLQTCIRVELYVVTDTAAAGRALLSDVDVDVPDDIVVRMNHEESLRHLMRITAGLESLVIGEDQILGQVRDAFQEAKEVGGNGPVLETALLKAIHVGERVRSETAINKGPTSVGGAAVRLAGRECDLDQSTALVIGTGEMGTHAAQAFSLRGVNELLLVNRTRARAERLAAMLDAPVRVEDFDTLPSALRDADIVISATGSQDPIVASEALASAGRTVVIDIAQPRDVAPAATELENVTVHDLDVLESITEAAREQRRDAAQRVETMVDDAVTALLDQYKRRRIDGVIAGMYQGAERMKRQELATARSKLDHHGGLTDEQRDDVEALADALVSQLLAPPTEALRAAAANDDWNTIGTAIELFDPNLDKDAQGLPEIAEVIGGAEASDVPWTAEPQTDD